MGSENRFVYNPATIDIERSKFNMNSFYKAAIYHGDLVPVEILRVMPGDSAKYDLDVFIRTATPPIAPFMDTIRLNLAAFYVPDRLIWDKTKEFYGENREGYGIQSEVLAPRSITPSMSVYKGVANTTYKRSMATYLGLVRQKEISTNYSPIAVNPIRSFLQVYNDWFRNENFMSPYLWNHSAVGDGASRTVATLNGDNIFANSDLPKVCKQLDRYTSCLPWAQKGLPVTIGLADEAPVFFRMKEELQPASMYPANPLEDDMKLYGLAAVPSGGTATKDFYPYLHGEDIPNGAFTFSIGSSTNGALKPFADLSKATATTINEFRLAFATQRYLEQLARSGSKYREYIKGMFGVNIGDTTAQMAEYLGGMTIELNVDQVLQQTGYVASSSTTLGAPGATSTSAASDFLFTKSFEEPGYLVIVAYTKHNRTYGQGIDEIYKKHEVLEEYNPKFANIGETAIYSSCLYFSGDADDDDDRFGFQEAWSEYRHVKDRVVGALCPSNSSSYNFWTLADNFANKPTLGAAFLTEDRNNIARALAGGESSPDYFLDIKFRRTFVRPMPLYSVPGLIDHH